MGSFSPSYIKFQLSTKELSLMTLKRDWKFQEKLRNFVNFHSTNQNSENFTSRGSFSPKYVRYKLKKYRGAFFHCTELWWGIGWISLEHSKSEKLYIDELFLSKASNVSARKFQRNYVSWHWRAMQNLKENYGLKT